MVYERSFSGVEKTLHRLLFATKRPFKVFVVDYNIFFVLMEGGNQSKHVPITVYKIQPYVGEYT